MPGVRYFCCAVGTIVSSSKPKELLDIHSRRLSSVLGRSTRWRAGSLLLLQIFKYVLLRLEIELPHRRPVALHVCQELHVLLDHVLVRLIYFVTY